MIFEYIFKKKELKQNKSYINIINNIKKGKNIYKANIYKNNILYLA